MGDWQCLTDNVCCLVRLMSHVSPPFSLPLIMTLSQIICCIFKLVSRNLMTGRLLSWQRNSYRSKSRVADYVLKQFSSTSGGTLIRYCFKLFCKASLKFTNHRSPWHGTWPMILNQAVVLKLSLSGYPTATQMEAVHTDSVISGRSITTAGLTSTVLWDHIFQNLLLLLYQKSLGIWSKPRSCT